MNEKQREDAIDLKIKLLREKSQKIEERHKLVEEDKQRAEARGNAVNRRHQTPASYSQKHVNNPRAHMDDPGDGCYDDRSSDFQRSRGYHRGRYGDSRGYGNRHGQFHQHGYERGDSYESEERGYHDAGKHNRGPQMPQQDHHNSQVDRKYADRESQRQSNIEKMEAQMSGKLQRGDEDWQEPVGFLQDPRREGEGEFERRPPPRGIRYNPNESRGRYQNRGYGGPQTKMDRTLEMTGRERQDYDKWKKQQEEADKYRLAKSQAEDGHWKRDWDSDKRTVDKDDHRHAQRRDPDYSRDNRRGTNRRDGNYNRRQNDGYRTAANNEYDSYQRSGPPARQYSDRGSRSNRNDFSSRDNKEDSSEWPSLQGGSQPKESQQDRRQPGDNKSTKRDGEPRSHDHNPLSNEETPSRDRKKHQPGGPGQRSQNPSQNLVKSPENQFQSRGGQGRSRGRGRGRGRGQDARHRDDRRRREDFEGSKSPRQNPKLTVNIPEREQKSEAQDKRKDSSGSNRSLNRTSSLTSPLKTPENFVPVGDWATEVESSCTRIDESAEEKNDTPVEATHKSQDSDANKSDVESTVNDTSLNNDAKTDNIASSNDGDELASTDDLPKQDEVVVATIDKDSSENIATSDEPVSPHTTDAAPVEEHAVSQTDIKEPVEDVASTDAVSSLKEDNIASTVGKVTLTSSHTDSANDIADSANDIAPESPISDNAPASPISDNAPASPISDNAPESKPSNEDVASTHDVSSEDPAENSTEETTSSLNVHPDEVSSSQDAVASSKQDVVISLDSTGSLLEDEDDDSFVTVGSGDERDDPCDEDDSGEEEFKDSEDVHVEVSVPAVEEDIEDIVTSLLEDVVGVLVEEVLEKDLDGARNDTVEESKETTYHLDSEEEELESSVKDIEKCEKNLGESSAPQPSLIPPSISQEEILTPLSETITVITRQSDVGEIANCD